MPNAHNVTSRKRRALAITLCIAALAVVLAGPSVHAHLRAAAFLARAAGGQGGLASLFDAPIVEENVVLHTTYGPFRARIYRPRDGAPHRGLVLAHGVHFLGIDEPRLVAFARNFARTGVVVLTPELAALADYRVHASSVDELREAVRALDRTPYVTAGGVGIMGLSFAGGLALVAAGDRSVRGHVAFVVCVGGHHALSRVSRFLATDTVQTPTGERHLHAHDYGLLVYFYAHAELFVAGGQLLAFRDALRQTLHSGRDAGARAAMRLEGSTRALFDAIARNDKATLAPRVLATIPALRGQMAALSPAGHVAGLQGVPVFLLHGAADDVIPPTEAEDNARELARYTTVHALISPNIKHVTLQGLPTLRERWRIVHTVALILGS